MPTNNKTMTPDTRLLIAPACPHCGSVTETLTKLVKEGLIGRLEIINLAVRPEAAAEVGTRSVPWFKIGEFEFTGAHSEQEIRRWAEKAAQGEGWSAYYHDLIDNRQLDQAISSLHQHPERLGELIATLEDKDLPMVVKIGIGAVIEDFEDTEELKKCIPQLERLTRSGDPGTRADACHYLGLTGSSEVIPALENLLNDKNKHVQEIAEETITELNA
jgi:glutaredoxin